MSSQKKAAAVAEKRKFNPQILSTPRGVDYVILIREGSNNLKQGNLPSLQEPPSIFLDRYFKLASSIV